MSKSFGKYFPKDNNQLSVGDGTITEAINALNTGLTNKEWTFLGEVSQPEGTVFTRSRVSGIKNLKIFVYPNYNINWAFEIDKMQSAITETLTDLFESKYIINRDNGDIWELIRVHLKTNKDGITLKHCDINGFDLTNNTVIRVFYNL